MCYWRKWVLSVATAQSFIKCFSLEELHGYLWEEGYPFQFEGDLERVHQQADRVMVGRAQTSVFVPYRPDVHEDLIRYGYDELGFTGNYNSWPISMLQENDILVVDLFDKIYKGTFVGGNLSKAVAAKTKRGGCVIWGGVRDLKQIRGIEEIQTYHRGYDPCAIADVIMTGLNVPCRIGKATCMPGDIVIGTDGGVLFIPPHLAEKAVLRAEKIKLRDIFGFQKLEEGTYTASEIDAAWSSTLWDEFHAWRATSEPAGFSHIEWSDADRSMDGDRIVRI